jgi:hypothetical protein
MIDDLQAEREALRKDKILFTSFVEDFKNKLMNVKRDYHKNAPKNKEYTLPCGTVFYNGKVCIADDVGRI